MSRYPNSKYPDMQISRYPGVQISRCADMRMSGYPSIMYEIPDVKYQASGKIHLNIFLRKAKKSVNEWGRLSHGNDAGVEYTDTIEYIAHTEVPKNKKFTYASFVCDCCPLKDEQWRVRLVVGGDKLPYDSDSGSPTTDMIETKLLINSTISDADKGARFATLDLKDMFLHMKMDDPEYMKVSLKYFPPDIIQRYNLHALIHNGYITMRINKGMYGLKQAALLAYETVSSLLINGGYTPIAGSLGLWTHKTRDLSFCLCVDDFGVQYVGQEHAKHLIKTLTKILRH